MPSICWRRGVLMSVLPLCGCAQTDVRPPPDEPGGQRIVLTTRSEYPNSGIVVTLVTNLSRVPVRDAMTVAPGVYRMTLVCADEAACRAAAQRIADDRSFALAVELDGRQKIPLKPTRDASR